MQEGGDDLLDYQQDGLLAHGQPDLLVGEEQVEKEDCLVEVDSWGTECCKVWEAGGG